jgi:hypothetical protein
MLRAGVLVGAAMLVSAAPADDWRALLHAERTSAGDIELGGELAGIHPSDKDPSPETPGVTAGQTRYVRYEELLRLPQETYTVINDSNFQGKTEISGVALSTLAETFGVATDMVVAICNDQYQAHYPADYVAAHHPVLALRINGLDRNHWPTAGNGESLGPYLISHPEFKPSFKVLSHEDEPQIPYGVVRIDFRKEAEVFGAIRPQGKWTTDSPVGLGYVIARQDCFRCHNMGAEGGTMAQRTWAQLAAIADKHPDRFRRIIRDPASATPGAKMPAQPGYDEATLDALTAYFKSFAGDGGNEGADRKKDPTQ